MPDLSPQNSTPEKDAVQNFSTASLSDALAHRSSILLAEHENVLPFEKIIRGRRDSHIQRFLAERISALSQGERICFRKYNSSSSILDHLCLSSRRGCIASASFVFSISLRTPGKSIPLTLVFYPRPEHVPHYLEAGSYSRRLGPGDQFPGSVGVLSMLWQREENVARILSLQSSVNHRQAQCARILQTESQGKQQKLQNHYAHWRFDLVKLAFRFFQKRGIQELLFTPLHENGLHAEGKVIAEAGKRYIATSEEAEVAHGLEKVKALRFVLRETLQEL